MGINSKYDRLSDKTYFGNSVIIMLAIDIFILNTNLKAFKKIISNGLINKFFLDCLLNLWFIASMLGIFINSLILVVL